MRYQNFYGIMFMILNAISLAACYAVMKKVLVDVSSSEATFLYKFMILIIILPWVFWKEGIKAIYTPNFKLHILRGCCSATGTLSFMYALKSLNIVDITVLTHLEQILWIVVAAMFFDEQISRSKIIAIIAGFFGAIIIVKSKVLTDLIYNYEFNGLYDFLIRALFNHQNITLSSEQEVAYIFVIITVLAWTTNSSLVKLLGKKKATNKAQMFYNVLFGTTISYVVACANWQYIDLSCISMPYPTALSFPKIWDMSSINITLLFASAVFHLVHNSAFFYALKFGEMSVIAPFIYFKSLAAGILGYICFSHQPLHISYIGYFLVIGAGIILLSSQYKEHKKKKQIFIEGDI